MKSQVWNLPVAVFLSSEDWSKMILGDSSDLQVFLLGLSTFPRHGVEGSYSSKEVNMQHEDSNIWLYMHVYEQKIYSSDPTCSCFAGSMARNDALQVDIPQLMQLYKNIILCNQKTYCQSLFLELYAASTSSSIWRSWLYAFALCQNLLYW